MGVLVQNFFSFINKFICFICFMMLPNLPLICFSSPLEYFKKNKAFFENRGYFCDENFSENFLEFTEQQIKILKSKTVCLLNNEHRAHLNEYLCGIRCVLNNGEFFFHGQEICEDFFSMFITDLYEKSKDCNDDIIIMLAFYKVLKNIAEVTKQSNIKADFRLFRTYNGSGTHALPWHRDRLIRDAATDAATKEVAPFLLFSVLQLEKENPQRADSYIKLGYIKEAEISEYEKKVLKGDECFSNDCVYTDTVKYCSELIDKTAAGYCVNQLYVSDNDDIILHGRGKRQGRDVRFSMVGLCSYYNKQCELKQEFSVNWMNMINVTVYICKILMNRFHGSYLNLSMMKVTDNIRFIESVVFRIFKSRFCMLSSEEDEKFQTVIQDFGHQPLTAAEQSYQKKACKDIDMSGVKSEDIEFFIDNNLCDLNSLSQLVNQNTPGVNGVIDLSKLTKKDVISNLNTTAVTEVDKFTIAGRMNKDIIFLFCNDKGLYCVSNTAAVFTSHKPDKKLSFSHSEYLLPVFPANNGFYKTNSDHRKAFFCSVDLNSEGGNYSSRLKTSDVLESENSKDLSRFVYCLWPKLKQCNLLCSDVILQDDVTTNVDSLGLESKEIVLNKVSYIKSIQPLQDGNLVIIGTNISNKNGAFVYDKNLSLIKEELDDDAIFFTGESEQFLLLGKNCGTLYGKKAHLLQMSKLTKKENVSYLFLEPAVKDGESQESTFSFSEQGHVSLGNSSIVSVSDNVFSFILREKLEANPKNRFDSIFSKKCKQVSLLTDGSVVCVTIDGRLEVYRDTPNSEVELIYQSAANEFSNVEKMQAMWGGRFAIFYYNGSSASNSLIVKIFKVSEGQLGRDRWFGTI